jgi:phosphoribosyl 1,2-cyclic phosphodiesterase
MSRIEFAVAGTGSSGNGYVLNYGNYSIVIEAGLPFKKVLPFVRGMIQLVIVSHEHGDHAKYLPDYKLRGYRILTKYGYAFGSLIVKPFKVQHDVETYGYLMRVQDHYLAYITDAFEANFKFTKLDTLIIEASYDEELLEESGLSGNIPPFLYQRIKQSHLSFQKSVEAVARIEKDCALKNVIFIHLSAQRSDENKLLNMARQVTGARIYVARSGETYKLTCDC